MEGSFGARLRLQRERQQVPLTVIADKTKIKITLLEGLERDDLSHWPAGIFRRSYIRAYAQAIGLEPEQVVREFLGYYPDPFEDDTVVEAVARAVDGTTRRPPMRLTYLISSAIKALPRRANTSTNKANIEEPAKDVDAEWLPDLATLVASSSEALEDARSFRDAEPEPLDARPDSDADIAAQAALFELSPPPPPGSAHHGVRGTQADGADLALGTLADLCTRLGRAEHAAAVRMVVEDATSIIGAIGLILWEWDAGGGALRPAVSHGYSVDMLAQVPPLVPESDNAIASAFRSSETRLVDGNDLETGALAVPLLAPFGCVGVLAAEFRNGGERRERARAILTILAAQLSMLIGQPPAMRVATA